ncbi:MAG: MBL fold metallo-hydrolase, partial [Dehalococcoidales bacterium]|nr:MBL fold metallo-hydrolase [Dehalococcoidales bacterium]
MVAVIRLAAAPSFASLEIPSVSLFWVFGYYAVLIVAVAVYYRWRHRRLVSFHSARTGMDLSRAGMLSGARWLVLPLLLLAALIAGTAVTFPEDDLTVSFLDVGQGDAVLIRRGSRQVLVDGGPSPREISLRLGEHMPFWDRSIDLVVLTHPHEDHLAGLVEVLRRYQVGRVLYPPSGANSSLSREWLRLVDERDIEVLPAATGQRISLGGGAFLDVLYVPEVSAAREEKSIVLSLECGAVSFLLTGDIAAPEEWELLRRRALDGCTVLKVPHHGSKTASSPEFLSMVRPKLAVISVGAANRYGLPDGDVIGRLEGLVGRDNIYRTDEHGSVTFVTDGSYLRVKTQK